MPVGAFLLLVALVLLVLAPFVWGTTPGMALADLRIRAEDGGSPTLAASFLRFLGFLLTGALAGVPLLLAAFDRRGRTLADLMSGTTVVARAAARRVMRLALAQLDTTVGDFRGNTAKIVAALGRGGGGGRPSPRRPRDWPSAATRPATSSTAPRSSAKRRERSGASRAGRRRPPSSSGRSCRTRGRPASRSSTPPSSSTAGRIRAVAKKLLLPTYDVFDEARHFEPGTACTVVPFGGERLGLSICEDLWNDKDFWRSRRLYRQDPGEEMVRRGATLILNISASPFSEGKPRLRRRMLARLSRDGRVPVAYVNLVGGNDELVFDGGTIVLDGRGKVAARGALFAEDFLVVDLPKGPAPRGVVPVAGGAPEDLPDDAEGNALESLRRALVLGIRDYAQEVRLYDGRSSASRAGSTRRSSRPSPSRPSAART